MAKKLTKAKKEKLIKKIERIPKIKEKTLDLLAEFFEAVEAAGLSYVRKTFPEVWRPVLKEGMWIRPPEDMYEWLAYFYDLPLKASLQIHEQEILQNRTTGECMDVSTYFNLETTLGEYRQDIESGRSKKPGYVCELPFPAEWAEQDVVQTRIAKIPVCGYIHPYHEFYEMVWGNTSRLHPYHCDYNKIMVECGAPPSDGYSGRDPYDDFLPMSWEGVGREMSMHHGKEGTWSTPPSVVFRNLQQRIAANEMKPLWPDWADVQSQEGVLRSALFVAIRKTYEEEDLQAA